MKSKRSNVKGTCYLIHFHQYLHHSRHYIGWTENKDIQVRFMKHKAGQGSRLLRALVQAGIKFRIVRIWENVDRNFERKLKNRKKSADFCPVCCKRKNKTPASCTPLLEATLMQGPTA